MKRIDDKIKQIEKKDKTNRLLYIGFVLLIALFMASILYFSKELAKREDTISDQEDTISQQKIKQSKTYKKLDSTYAELQKSLRPEQYWDYIKKENSVESYINYITNDWGITKPAYVQNAIDILISPSSNITDFKGWLFVGIKNSDGVYESRNIVEVVYRYGSKAESDIKNSEIQVGDIVQLTKTQDRYTYKNKTMKGSPSGAWRNKTKGFVSNVWQDPNSLEVRIEVKYY